MTLIPFHINFWAVTALYAAALIAFLFRRRSLPFVFLGPGWLIHTIFLIRRAGLVGIWSPYAFFEETYFLPRCLASLAFGLRCIPGKSALSGALLFPLTASALLSFLFPPGVIPPNPKTQTIFSWFFFLLEVVSQACFVASGALGIVYLLREEGALLLHSFLHVE